MSRLAFAAIGSCVALAATLAGAEPAPSTTTLSSAACTQESTAIGRSACGIVAALTDKPTGALVVAAAVPSAGRVAVPEKVSERLAELVAAKLGASAQAHRQQLGLAEAQKLASPARGLVYLSVSLSRDRVDVSADVYLGAGHFWQRLRDPTLRLKSRATANAPLDAELRALFPAIPLLVGRIDKATVTEHDILALACGDLRGDGSREIATVGRRMVQVGWPEHGHFTPRASLSWADYSKVAAAPLREPIATGALPESGRLWVGLSDRADALELSGALQLQHKWHGVMPWPGAGCTHRVGLGYDGKSQACPGAGPSVGADFQTPVDAFAARLLTSQSGQVYTLRVARPVGSDVARALDSLHPEVSIPNVGAQLAVGDLDEDGQPEIVSSSPSLDRNADQLLVRTLTDNGQLRERLRIPVPSGIDALAICPGDGRTMAPLALATGDGLWVIR